MSTIKPFFNVKLLALSLPLALAACSTAKVSPEARAVYDTTQSTLVANPVTIVSDGCAIWVEMGKDDIRFAQSEVAAKSASNTLAAKLNAKEVKVAKTTSPFVCGVLSESELLKMDIISTEDAKDVVNTKYPILSTSNSFDTVTNQAYLNLYQAIQASNKAKKEEKRPPEYQANLGLDASSLNTIRRTEGSDKVFVIMVQAVKQSFGLKFTVNATSPLAGALINRPENKFYQVSLVNLKTNKVEWSKLGGLPENILEMKEAQTLQINEVLDPLYVD